MKLTEIWNKSTKPTISFELYPPRTLKAAEKLEKTIDTLTALKPDFASVTFGAGGSTREALYRGRRQRRPPGSLSLQPGSNHTAGKRQGGDSGSSRIWYVWLDQGMDSDLMGVARWPVARVPVKQATLRACFFERAQRA